MKLPKPKVKEPRARKIVIDNTALLSDVVVDGAVSAAPGTRVVFERLRGGKTRLHEGYIVAVRGGVLEIWDETEKQFWIVELASPPPLLKLSK